MSERSLKERLHEVIFEAHTPSGRAFDIILFGMIALSLVIVSLESVHSVNITYGSWFDTIEWVITVVFTIELVFRLMVMKKPLGYLFSFYGIVDLVSILPTYLAMVVPGAESFLLLRTLRLLRIFRVFKLTRFVRDSVILKHALRNARGKIIVFLMTVLSVATFCGGMMYVIEGPASGFTSIPRGVYWAIVTLTTVGYGDIAPQTTLGQALAAAIMILGYGVIAVPTGIVSVEIAEASKREPTQCCDSCGLEGHEYGAKFCRRCGAALT